MTDMKIMRMVGSTIKDVSDRIAALRDLADWMEVEDKCMRTSIARAKNGRQKDAKIFANKARKAAAQVADLTRMLENK